MKYAIIVAGGKGERMNAALRLRSATAVPKQFLPLAGKPVLMHTLQAFADYDRTMKLILVLPAAQIEFWKRLCDEHAFDLPHQIVAGGSERFYSVRNGLATLTELPALVAVHDGVRPLVSRETIARCFDEAARSGAAIPVIAPTDSIRQLDDSPSRGGVDAKSPLRGDSGGLGCSRSVDRRLYCLVQTPQVFDAALLKRAYEQPYTPEFTDDASVVEALGASVSLVESNPENLKITTPMDLMVAEILIEKGNKESC